VTKFISARNRRSTSSLSEQQRSYCDEAPSTNVNLTNSVTNAIAITEDRRRELIAKRREANERLKAMKQARMRGIVVP
jgi:hypothetical protein